MEGAGQVGQAICWGNGFITDPAFIASTGISDPNPFFQELLTRPYAGSVVINPHLYGPSITGMSTGYSGQVSFTAYTFGQQKPPLVCRMPCVYVVQVEYDDNFMFFLTEEDAQRKVEELRRESREKYPISDDSEDDSEDRWRYTAVEEGQLWWPGQGTDDLKYVR